MLEIWFTLKIERKANNPESECLLLAITKGLKHHKPSASGWRVQTSTPPLSMDALPVLQSCTDLLLQI
jgi:hypothetical protein